MGSPTVMGSSSKPPKVLSKVKNTVLKTSGSVLNLKGSIPGL